MKKSFILGLISLSVMAVSCQEKETVLVAEGENTVTLNATIAPESKSSVTEDGVFTWATNDEMSVYTTNNRFVTFYLDAADNGKATGKFKGNLEDGESPAAYAIYPWAQYHEVRDGVALVHYSDFYGYVGYTNHSRNAHAVMIAEVGTDGNLAFNHLGGVLRFNIAGVPAGTAQLVFKTDETITGVFAVENGVLGECVERAGNEVRLRFNAFASATDEIFNVPLPAGEYDGFTLELQDAGSAVLASLTSTKKQTLGVGQLARLPKLMVDGSNIVKWGNLARVDNDHLRTVTGTGSVSVSLTSPVTEDRTINMVHASSKVAEYNAANGTSFLTMDASKVNVTSVEIANGAQTGSFTYTIDVEGIENYTDAYLVPITINETSLPAGVVLGEQSTVYIEVRKSIAGTYSAEYITSVYEGTGTFSDQSGYLYYGPTVYLAEGNFYDSVNQQAYYVRYHDQYDLFVLFDISDEPMEGHDNCVKLTNLQDRIASPGYGHDAITSSSYFNTVTGEIVFDMWIDGYQEDKLLACRFYK